VADKTWELVAEHPAHQAHPRRSPAMPPHRNAARAEAERRAVFCVRMTGS
jgi:hypothetical protein